MAKMIPAAERVLRARELIQQEGIQLGGSSRDELLEAVKQPPRVVPGGPVA